MVKDDGLLQRSIDVGRPGHGLCSLLVGGHHLDPCDDGTSNHSYHLQFPIFFILSSFTICRALFIYISHVHMYILDLRTLFLL